MSTTAKIPFFEKLSNAHKRIDNHFCFGIDPDLSLMEPSFINKELQRAGLKKTLETYAQILIDVAEGKVSALKFQSAYFEAYGAPGFEALKTSINYAHGKNLLAILDAKRSDISSTMAAYGKMAFEYLQADAMTVVPYFGVTALDCLKPWLQTGKGIYLVWLSSNPEATTLQELFSSQLLSAIGKWRDKNKWRQSIGIVLGATKVPQLKEDLLKMAMSFPLLLPGLGAQGGSLSEVRGAMKNFSDDFLFPISRQLSASQATSWEQWRQDISSNFQRFSQK